MSLPRLTICDSCREDHHEDCVDNMTSMHDDSGPKRCWCIRCSWTTATTDTTEKDVK